MEIFSPSSAKMPGIRPVLLSRLLESDQLDRSELQRHDGDANQEGGRQGLQQIMMAGGSRGRTGLVEDAGQAVEEGWDR